MDWVESAMLNETLGVMETFVVTLCTWFFLSHTEQGMHRKMGFRFVVPVFYWAGFAGITFGMKYNSFINLVLPSYMVVMTMAAGCWLYNRGRIYVFYYFLFPVTVVAAQIFIGYLVLGYMSARWGTLLFDYYLSNVELMIRQLAEILLTGVWVVLLGKRKYEDVRGAWFAGLFLPPAVSAFIIFSLICIGNVFMQLYGVFLIIADIFLLVFLNFYFWFLFSYQSRNKKLKAELEIRKRQSEMLYQYYGRVEQQYLSSRKMIHDMRNHLQAIEALNAQDEAKGKAYVKDLHQMLDSLALVRYTDDRMLNIILNEKAKAAEEQGIVMDIEIGEASLGHIRDMDITTIFANLLDNALEAAGQSSGERRIWVRGDSFHDFVVVRIQNTISEDASCRREFCMQDGNRRRQEFCVQDGNRRRQQKFCVRDAQDGNRRQQEFCVQDGAAGRSDVLGKGRDVHVTQRERKGIGMENVRYTLEKYGGGMLAEVSGNEFIVNLTIPGGMDRE